MIDFNKCKEIFNKFSGSEVKTAVKCENTIYMIKYPDPVRQINNTLSYMNNQFSEHIGCNIFRACGFNAQETALGYFTKAGIKEKLVVGCKDFTQGGYTLYEFSKFVNQTLVDRKSDTSIENVIDVINQNDLIDRKNDITEKFWDMFVIDALIGNSDRHFDNWGFLEKNGELTFAPIYDCGSSLAALIHDDKMKCLLCNETDFKNNEFNKSSCYYMNDKRIFYHVIFKIPPDGLAEAIKRIVPKINMGKIHGIVDSVTELSGVRKEYINKALDLRYEQILYPALLRGLKKDKINALPDKSRSPGNCPEL